MQTFLPFSDFKKSAEVLDYRRLGKQRVEAWQIYLALTQEKYGWKNHPAVKMWKGHEFALLGYGMAICAEWINRGYKDTMMERFINASSLLQITINPIYNYEKPRWIGNEALHKSHRARLHQKDPVHYAQFKADDEGQDYVWVTE